MTRISSSQRGLNSILDQMINSRNDAASAGNADSGQTSAFDSHLARFSPDSGGNAKSGDAQASNTASGETASRQNGPADAVSSLFAALGSQDDDTSADVTVLQSTNLLGQAAGDDKDAASLLFAALNGTDQNVNAGASVQNLSPLSKLLSLAAKATSTQAGAAAGTGHARRASSSGSEKSQDQTVSPSSDITASAQATVAALAASLTPQTPAVSQAPRKEVASSGTGANVPTIRSSLTNAKPSRETDIQSASDAVQFPAQNESFNLFGGDSSPSGGSSQQTIKMTVSSIQAETHFAPVQQLSPTQQIVDFIATTAGGAADESGGSDAAAASTSGPDMTPAATASLSGSPLKTLTLSLEPDALGTVTITMRLVNSNLDLKVETEKQETASLIEKDKGNLSDKLQSLGYSVDSMVVKTAMAQGSHLDPSNDQSTAGQGQQAGTDTASGSSQNGGRNTNDQSPAQTDRQAGSGLNQEIGADLSSLRTLGDGVYV